MDIIDTKKGHSNAVSIPTAQTTKLCVPSTKVNTSENRLQYQEILLKNQYPTLYIVYLLQKKYSLRITEVLSIKHQNITKKGNALVLGCKGSCNKFIDLDEAKDYFIDCKKRSFNPFLLYDRYFVYRVYKKLGINSEYAYGSKVAVTHGFRYAKAQEIKEIDETLDTAQLVLGHKSQNSTKHYVK